MKKSEKEMTYAAAMTELEAIVGQLQNPECEVDRLCELTARAVELLQYCKGKLTRTDEELMKLFDGIDSGTLQK